MSRQITLVLSPREAADVRFYTALAARRMGVAERDVALVRVVKRSIDARQRQPKVNLTLDIFVDGEPTPGPVHFDYPSVAGRTEVVIVGAGPAGLFAALRLIELGLRPVLLERGRDVSARKVDIARINRNGRVDPDSNYAFGEGGAGTFSDGKLFTRSKKRGDYNKALRTLVFHGATPEILYEAHPHIGTDRLPGIIRNIRKTIVDAGGEVLFERRVTGLIIKGGRICGVECGDERIEGAAVVLATGHSAHDIYELLHRQGVRLEAKPFAMGVRIEHPQEMINKSQYGAAAAKLPPASYKVTARGANDRGVYSFCMCPGGFVVNASSEEKRLAVNGMSNSRRDGANANSAIIVSVTPEDFAQSGPLSGVMFQQNLEEQAFLLGNGAIPQQLYGDFKRRQKTKSESQFPSYACGATEHAPLHMLFGKEIYESFLCGMEAFGRKIQGFDCEDAILSGVESRTSSPVKIHRNADFQSEICGIYPCGEGAGYAGGIMSAAMDGIKVAEAVAHTYTPDRIRKDDRF